MFDTRTKRPTQGANEIIKPLQEDSPGKFLLGETIFRPDKTIYHIKSCTGGGISINLDKKIPTKTPKKNQIRIFQTNRQISLEHLTQHNPFIQYFSSIGHLLSRA